MSTSKPCRRNGGVTVRELGDEIAIYDDTTRTAYALRGAEASVWRLSDGARTVAEIARETDLSAKQVEQIVNKLTRATLLQGAASTGRLVSRRFAMQLLAGGAAALSLLGRARPVRAGNSGNA